MGKGYLEISTGLGSSAIAAIAAPFTGGASAVAVPVSLTLAADGVVTTMSSVVYTAEDMAKLVESVGSGGGGKKTQSKKDSDTKVPQKAKDALEKIDKDPEAYLEDYYGGVEFNNRPNTKLGETEIPNENITIYTEYDINPYKYGKPRVLERIVTGLDGSAWYTPDHYKTWYQMR